MKVQIENSFNTSFNSQTSFAVTTVSSVDLTMFRWSRETLFQVQMRQIILERGFVNYFYKSSGNLVQFYLNLFTCQWNKLEKLK